MRLAFFEHAFQRHIAQFGAIGGERFDKGFAVAGNGICAFAVKFTVFKCTDIAAAVLAFPCTFAGRFAVFADIAIISTTFFLIRIDGFGNGRCTQH